MIIQLKSSYLPGTLLRNLQVSYCDGYSASIQLVHTFDRIIKITMVEIGTSVLKYWPCD